MTYAKVNTELESLYNYSLITKLQRVEAHISHLEIVWGFKLTYVRECRERYQRVLNTGHDFKGVIDIYERNVRRLNFEWEIALDSAIETGDVLIAMREEMAMIITEVKDHE